MCGVVVGVGGVTPLKERWEAVFCTQSVVEGLLVSVVEEGVGWLVGDVVDVLGAGVSGLVLVYRVLTR